MLTTDNQNTANFQSQPFPGSTVFTPAPSPKKLPAKNILLAGVLILVLVGLILGFSKARSFLSKAEGSCSPSNIQEANLTANSIEITFQTEKACLTELSYGTSAESLFLKIPEERAALNHRLKLSPLLPSTTYYYQVLVEEKKVGTVRSFLTKIASTPVTPTLAPTLVPTKSDLVPTAIPTQTVTYTFEDFVKQYGSANAVFDFDKNGIVNSSDWLEYQKTHQ